MYTLTTLEYIAIMASHLTWALIVWFAIAMSFIIQCYRHLTRSSTPAESITMGLTLVAFVMLAIELFTTY